MPNNEKLPFCECGECGRRVTKKGNRFIHGHNMRGTTRTPKTCAKMSAKQKGVPKPPRTPEHCSNISKALTGIPHTPEHNSAISKGNKESEVKKKQIETMCGGNDLVTHHYIYDHDDLSLNTVQMTRKDHTSLHRLLQKLGYIVPHINVPDDHNQNL